MFVELNFFVGTPKRGVLKIFAETPCAAPKYAHLGAQELARGSVSLKIQALSNS